MALGTVALRMADVRTVTREDSASGWQRCPWKTDVGC